MTYGTFFLLFFILTPIFIFHALGYRYDFNTKVIEKNGAFYIKSYPRAAEIYIDNEKMGRKTPTQITNIKPGTRNIKVQKDGYVPWSKELNIYPGETTFVEDVVLFLEQRDKINLGPGSTQFLINKNQDKYVYLDVDKNLIVTDVEQIKNYNIHKFDKDYILLDWSADNQKLLLRDTNEYFIFDINQKNINKLNLELVDKIIWDNQQGDLLWYLKDKEIFKYDANQVFEPQVQMLDLAKYVNDFDLKDDYLMIQYSTDDNNIVEQFRKNDYKSIKKIDNLNLGKLETLKADDHYLVFVLGSEVYIKNTYRDLIDIPTTMTRIHDQRLLMSNGHEITLYNYEDDQQELIDRSSNIVSDLLWHPNGSYFVTETENKTRITEIDGRDHRNSIPILENPLKKTYIFNSKGDKLFILTSEENYYLNIQ